MRLAVLLTLSLGLPASLQASPIFFAVEGTNVGSSSTIIHTNYNNSNGTHLAKLDTSGPMSPMVLSFSNNLGTGVPTNGDTITSVSSGSFQLAPKGGSSFPAGMLTLESLSLVLGHGSDGQGHHIDSGLLVWSFVPDNGDPNYLLSDVAVFSNLDSGIFNHVAIDDLQNGEWLIAIDLWGGFLHPSNGGNLFPNGLGIDLSLAGPSVAPGPISMPEPAACLTWLLVGMCAMAFLAAKRQACAFPRRPGHPHR